MAHLTIRTHATSDATIDRNWKRTYYNNNDILYTPRSNAVFVQMKGAARIYVTSDY